jgi:type I restriction enzyme S subunit
MYRFRVDPHLDPRYVEAYLQSDDARLTIDSMKTGGSDSGLNLTNARFRTLPLPIAPLLEQARIVTAMDEAFSVLGAGEAGLNATRTRLKRMRDSVLAAAVTGKLVPQDPTDSSVAATLAEIGVAAVTADGLPAIPASWSWALVKDVGKVDLGRQRHPDWHTGPNMKPYLRVANVFEDRIDTSDVMQMHFEPDVFEKFRLVPGDVLLNEGQTPELLGRPALYRGEPPEVAFTNSILRFKSSPCVLPTWALVVFRAYMRTGRFTRESRITTNIAHLSAGRLKEIEFPVPPIEEQARIVAEVERHFSFIEAAERAVSAALVRSAGLRRSVLKAAFEGQLVPQDPSDEPATVLLETIAAERAAAPKVSRRGRTKVDAS